MATEKELKDLEAVGLDDKIARIEKLLEGKEKPRAFELGLLLALKMAKEIREGKELGSDSSYVVVEWTKQHPESIVNEAIAHAKEFLLNPGKLAEKIKESLLKEQKTENRV